MKSFLSRVRQWLATLKFKIVALAVVTGVLSAGGTTALVVYSVQESMRRMVLSAAAEDREQSASLLGSKVTTLTETLVAVARQSPAAAWDNPAIMQRYLLDKPALGALFSSFYGVDREGRMLARVESGSAAALVDVSDRAYFKRAISNDQPVISEALLGKLLQTPIIVIAVPVIGVDGRPVGILAGSISLKSSALFQDLRVTTGSDSSRDLVIDRQGRILSHPNPSHAMLNAEDEVGLREMVKEWRAAGSPIDTMGSASVRGRFVVSHAGIPLTDWMHLRVTPTDVAFAPVNAARASAWPAAAIAGVLAAVLAGAMGYRMTRPISRLRACTESLVDMSDVSPRWPIDTGEVGDLAMAFRVVVEQREQRQAEVNALLQQLEAVLDHADIGIALTRSGRFELVSRQFCLMFRCDKADAVGMATRGIYPSDAAFGAVVQQAGPAFIAHGWFDCELELVRHTGEVFWARLRGRAVVPGDVTQGTIWTIEDVTAARNQRERLAYEASHDALTGLLNRAAFELLLEAATTGVPRSPFCALFIDLDRFKQVNDTGGHAAGDQLLRDVSRVLTGQVRKTDAVARMGGDEFAVLLPSCPPVQARVIADALCEAIAAYSLNWEGSHYAVGASIGLVEAGADFLSTSDVLRAADTACYQAKRRGRSRVEVFSPTGPQELIV